MRFIHINDYEYMNNYVQYIILHTRIRIYVHTLQHIYNNIDVTNIQFKGLIFSRPPAVAVYDV